MNPRFRLRPGHFGVLLLAAAFVASTARVARRTVEENDPDRIVIRFAHWHLEDGVKEAFDLVVADYEALHPNVRVIPMRIPEKVFPQWAMTQLVGGTAPDILEIGHNLETVIQARHFEPISRFVNDPNPYNEGTPLEGVPWRSTFIDGLASGYTEKLAEYYGIPCFFATVRVFVNLDLLERITGSDEPPRDFDGFRRLGPQVDAWARAQGLPLVAIAGSRDNAPLLLDQVYETVTQRLVHAHNPVPNLFPSPDSFYLAYLGGDWSLDDPAVRAGLGLMREFGRHMSPGFLQLRREDALFAFSQGHALMVAAGSWEATGLRAQTDFRIGVVAVPLPTADHPEYGRFTDGPPAESSGRAATGPFGIVNSSRHPEVALDFLRFLSSQRAHRRFVERSGWLPVVHGVEVPESMRGFEPDLDGALAGLSLRWGVEIRRVTENQWHHLFSSGGGVDAFVDALRPLLGEAVRRDLQRRDRRLFLELGIADPGLEANRQLRRRRPDDAVLAAKHDSMLAGQNAREAYYHQMHLRLAQVEEQAAAAAPAP